MANRPWGIVSGAMVVVVLAVAFVSERIVDRDTGAGQVLSEPVSTPHADLPRASPTPQARTAVDAGDIAPPRPGAPVAGTPLPLTDFGANRATLEALAHAGRADAASRLGQVLMTCRHHVAQTREQIEHETIRRVSANPSRPTDPEATVASVSHTVDALMVNQVLCDGVPRLEAEDEREGFEWMIRAANLGDPLAMSMRFDVELRKADYDIANIVQNAEGLLALQPIAAQMLQRAAATGEPVALYRLARAHASGVLADRDPVRARAYEIAAVHASGQRGQVRERRSFRSDGLDAEQQREAERLSGEILARCCEGR